LWNFAIGYSGDVTLIVVLSLIAFLGVLALGLLVLLRRQSDMGSLLILWFAFPLAMTYLMALRLPMYVDRYMMPAFPAFLLIVVRGLMALGRRWRALGLVALVVLSAVGTTRIYHDPVYWKEDWRGVAQYIEQHQAPGDLVMPLLYQSLTPLLGQYYGGRLPVEPLSTGAQAHDPEAVTEGYRRAWFVVPYRHNSTHLLAQCQFIDSLDPASYRDKVVQVWIESHEADVELRLEFTCISLLLFDLEVAEQ
jgi:hypothetical protein